MNSSDISLVFVLFGRDNTNVLMQYYINARRKFLKLFIYAREKKTNNSAKYKFYV